MRVFPAAWAPWVSGVLWRAKANTGTEQWDVFFKGSTGQCNKVKGSAGQYMSVQGSSRQYMAMEGSEG